MMEYSYYAQLDENRVCVAVSMLNGVVEREDMIPLTEDVYASSSLLGKRYNGGQWVEPEEREGD